MRLVQVSADEFRVALRLARLLNENVHDFTSAPEDMPDDADYFVSEDGASGFGVTHGAELVGLYSLVKGRGSVLVESAGTLGALYLDCFDGYLPELYARHGWREYRREPNWTEGEPDVVYMTRV